MTTYVIEITKIANNFQRNGQRERRLGGREGVGRILRRGLAEGVGGGGRRGSSRVHPFTLGFR